MRSVHHAKTTDPLGRYYTHPHISDFLVSLLPRRVSSGVLDLGAGEGALTIAASTRWIDASLVTVDIDRKAARVLSRRLGDSGFSGTHHHVAKDALGPNIGALFTRRSIDAPGLGVCNPPFLVPKWRKPYGEILEDAGFSGNLPAIATTDAAVLFLAQNLRLIAHGGSLAIIVPDSIASAAKYCGLRRSLLEFYDVQQAIRLPRNSFVGTDALAHVLVVRNARPNSPFIRLRCMDETGQLSEEISIYRDQAERRLDYKFHAARASMGTRRSLMLGQIALDVRRGTLNSAEARAANFYVLHTTHVLEEMCGKWFDFGEQPLKADDELSRATLFAESGDILIARVGRNAAQKIIGVASGRIAISDCLFRIRVPDSLRKRVLSSLSSNRGRQWIEAQAYGVAARHISKSDLLRFPL